MTDSADAGGDPLLALFRHEVAAGVEALGGGLAVLAVDPDHRDQFEPMERAAAHVKAAALVVGVDVAAELARAIEAVFQAARQNPAVIAADRVADLLAAVDLLKAVGEAAGHPDAPQPDADQVSAAVRKLRVDMTPPAPSGPEPAPPPTHGPERPPVQVADTPVVVTPRASPAVPVVEAVRPSPQPTPPVVRTQPVVTPKPVVEIHDASLLELFREEVRSLCDALSTGLVELESAAADPRRIEPLMRAAHSIKGAARIVSADHAVDLAHAMEEMFVAAQKGKFRIEPADVDTLLTAVDHLALLAHADIGEWAETHGARVAGLAATLSGRRQGAAPPAAPPAPPNGGGGWVLTPPPPADPAPPSASLALPDLTGDEDDFAGLPHPPGPTPPEPPPPDVAEPERIIRISAQSLTRLLSLAGESLVEARWLHPFGRSLLKLKKYQDHLADVIDDVVRTLQVEGGSERVHRLADDARKRIADCRHVLAGRVDEFENHARQSDDLNSRLYREVIASRMRPFGDVTHGFSRMARDVARQLGKKVNLEIAGQDTDVDRDILDKLDGPLGHILRNALDHGFETPEERIVAGKPEVGRLRIEARHHAGMLNISVADDGRGIDLGRLRRKVVDKGLTTQEIADRLSDPELLDFLFLPGFSTKDQVTDVSGRGVGLDVVQNTIQAVGGQVRIITKLGVGTTFDLQLPITLSVVRAVLVRIAGDPYAVPLNRTDRLLRLKQTDVRMLEGKPHFEADGRHIGLVPAHLVFDMPSAEPTSDEVSVVLIGDRAHQYGLMVEGFLGEQDLVVRPLDARMGKVPNVAAAALLENGDPVLIVDVDDVARSIALLVHEGKLRHQRPGRRESRKNKRVLVVDDSAIVREVEKQILRGRGYDVDWAVDGMDGWNALLTGGYDLVVTDIDMPRMNGLQFIRTIRSDPRVQSVPVVIVSYKDRDEDRVRGMEAGANYYLTKSSFHDGRFIQAVEELVGSP